MDQATIDSTNRWLTKASHDLLAAEAFAAAQRIYAFVRSLLPKETHPA